MDSENPIDNDTPTTKIDYQDLTVELLSAFVSHNSVRAADLPELIVQVHATLVGLSTPAAAPADAVEKATPAQTRKSITPDALISFIDGKPYKTLKRHLGLHGLTPEGYRAHYGLPVDYPTVSANYSAARSALAREIGCGIRRKAAPAAVEAPAARKAKAPRISSRLSTSKPA